MSPFRVDWHPGPSAQLEVFSPQGSKKGLYQLKYTSPFRPTLRSPAERRPLGKNELDPINAGLDALVDKLGLGATRGGGLTPGAPTTSVSDAQVRMVGGQLLDLIVPTYVQVDLRASDLFLEIGVDEKLLGFPWELMHNGDQFLCLKHFMGRFVNASTASPPSMHASSWLGGQLAELSVLVVSVPNPQPRGAAIYELLPEADAETDAIVDSLTSIKGVKPTLLKGKDATFDNVWGALKANSYQILHFNGHASFNEDQPQSSGLVLYDRDMTTGALTSFLSKGPPVFCFVNACETSKVTLWEDRYNIYGVAQAILQTGSYLLGSRWKLTDTAAAAFAGKFYEAWLGGGKSLGEAIRDARLECRKGASPDDLAWASYVFYGDPRVYFRNTG